MVPTLFVTALALLLLPATAIPAQDNRPEEEPIWLLAQHDLADEEQRQDISRIVAEDYLPVGIEQRGTTVWMLYYRSPDVSISRWTIQEFEDLDSLDQDMSAPMTEGWVPMDISRTENGLTVLYVETDDITAEGWRIDISPLAVGTMQSTFSKWRREGFTPFGFSLSPLNEVWYLLIDQGDLPEQPEVFLNGYPRIMDQLRDAVNEDVTSGNLPWGLMVGEETIYIQYLR